MVPHAFDPISQQQPDNGSRFAMSADPLSRSISCQHHIALVNVSTASPSCTSQAVYPLQSATFPVSSIPQSNVRQGRISTLSPNNQSNNRSSCTCTCEVRGPSCEILTFVSVLTVHSTPKAHPATMYPLNYSQRFDLEPLAATVETHQVTMYSLQLLSLSQGSFTHPLTHQAAAESSRPPLPPQGPNHPPSHNVFFVVALALSILD